MLPDSSSLTHHLSTSEADAAVSCIYILAVSTVLTFIWQSNKRQTFFQKKIKGKNVDLISSIQLLLHVCQASGQVYSDLVMMTVKRSSPNVKLLTVETADLCGDMLTVSALIWHASEFSSRKPQLSIKLWRFKLLFVSRSLLQHILKKWIQSSCKHTWG